MQKLPRKLKKKIKSFIVYDLPKNEFKTKNLRILKYQRFSGKITYIFK